MNHATRQQAMYPKPTATRRARSSPAYLLAPVLTVALAAAACEVSGPDADGSTSARGGAPASADATTTSSTSSAHAPRWSDAGTGGAGGHGAAAGGAGAGGAGSTASSGGGSAGGATSSTGGAAGAGGAGGAASSTVGAGGAGSTVTGAGSTVTGAGSASSATGGGPPGALRVLFVGNSFTYGWDVPGRLDALALAAGEPSLDVGTVASPGETLKQHHETGDVRDALDAARWDIVVLQEHPSLPATAKAQFFEYATKLGALVASHGAETWLYVTWAEQAQTAADQQVITNAYVELAQQLHATVVPVGPAFQHALAADASLGLYFEDGFHASPAGAYLAACVFYASLYGRTPAGLPAPQDVPAGDAPLLQSVAWTTYAGASWSF